MTTQPDSLTPSTSLPTPARQRRSLHAALLATVLAAPLLAGCVPLVVGGGALTAVMVATDRRTTGMQLEDERIEQSISSQVRQQLPDQRVHATSFNRIVLLTGEVRSEQDKHRAEQLAQNVENVRSVVNELAIVPFISSLGQRTGDTYITTKVKASLVNAQDLNARAIKVVTELNVVYLMGIVTPAEARRAAEIARGVNDVSKVVRIFETITEAELAAYHSAQQPPQASSATQAGTQPAIQPGTAQD